MRKSSSVGEAPVILLELGQDDDVVALEQFANCLLATWERQRDSRRSLTSRRRRRSGAESRAEVKQRVRKSVANLRLR